MSSERIAPSGDVAIQVAGLGKCYQIYQRPHDRLKQFVLPRLQTVAGRTRSTYFQQFWALRDVTFELRRGETLGIIGRNGSGKSTLLHLICGTLNPTQGTVQVNGRVAALLELGSGFNPEFTGRENVYMSASIYGLSREETNSRFDAIAAFADIGDHLEQPVKTYSTGMAVRLAFAVVAHVDADVMVIDEALAVGDAVFTQKCMRFIRGFQERGTLLFVSHDTGAVQSLCRSAVWLHGGQVQQQGSAKAVCEAYLKHTLQDVYGTDATLHALDAPEEPPREDVAAVADHGSRFAVTDNASQARGWRTGVADVLSTRIERLDGLPSVAFEGGERVRLRIRARAHEFLSSPILGFMVKDRLGQILFGENTLPFTSVHLTPVSAGQDFEAEFVFRLPMLLNGDYAVTSSVANGTLYEHVQHHWLHDALIIHVSSSAVRWGLVGIQFETTRLTVILGDQ